MHTALRLGTLVLALGLIALGILAVLFPGPSSVSYGVPSADATWVAATGCRDLALGSMLLLLRARQADALRWFLPPLLILPVADAVLVLLAGRPLLNTLPHAAGVLVISGLAALSWHQKPERTHTKN